MTDQDRRPDRLDALLARGRPSGPAREETLARVLDARARPARLGARAAAWAPALAVAAAAIVVATRVLAPGAHGGGESPPGAGREAPAAAAAEGFASKGGPATPGGMRLDLGCGAEAPAPRCGAGNLLTLRVEGAPEGFVTAWAEPATAGARVWYLEGEAARVRGGADVELVRRAVRLSKTQAPGRWTVHAVVTPTPLDREAALAVAARAAVLAADASGGAAAAAYARADLEVLP